MNAINDEHESAGQSVRAAMPTPAPPPVTAPNSAPPDATPLEGSLRRELLASRGHIDAIIAELEASNDELRSGNEALLATESKLQHTNDALRAANEELYDRNLEARRINDDLANVQRSAGVAIVLLGTDARIRRFTPQGARLLRLSDADLGRSVADIQSALLTPGLLALVERVLDDLLPREQTVTDENGRWYQLSVRPYVTLEHKIDGTVLSLVDVDSIERGRAALRDMLAAAAESIVMARENGIVTFANAAASRTFGYSPEEFVGLRVEALIPDEARNEHAEHRAFFHRGHGAHPAIPAGERLGLRKDGSTFPVEMTLSTMQSEQGELGVAFITDITERRASEERIRSYEKKLQEASFDAAVVEEKARRRIAAGLHDNIGQTLVLAQMRLNNVRQAAGPAVSTDLDAALLLIGEAIQETRSLTFELSPPVLYDLGLPAAVGWLGEQLEAEHDVRVSVGSDDPLATLDEETAALLFRSVRELLSNVVKHADTPSASVEMHRDGNELTVVVADGGAGFDPSRLHAYEKTSGFGLFSVREQIKRLGGSVEIDSGAGCGTKVTLRVLVDAFKSDIPPRDQP